MNKNNTKIVEDIAVISNKSKSPYNTLKQIPLTNYLYLKIYQAQNLSMFFPLPVKSKNLCHNKKSSS